MFWSLSCPLVMRVVLALLVVPVVAVMPVVAVAVVVVVVVAPVMVTMVMLVVVVLVMVTMVECSVCFAPPMLPELLRPVRHPHVLKKCDCLLKSTEHCVLIPT